MSCRPVSGMRRKSRMHPLAGWEPTIPPGRKHSGAVETILRRAFSGCQQRPDAAVNLRSLPGPSSPRWGCRIASVIKRPWPKTPDTPPEPILANVLAGHLGRSERTSVKPKQGGVNGAALFPSFPPGPPSHFLGGPMAHGARGRVLPFWSGSQ